MMMTMRMRMVMLMKMKVKWMSGERRGKEVVGQRRAE